MTQNDMILQYLREEGSITPMEALEEFGCMRLASRINEMSRYGIRITKVIEKGVNRFGEPTKYARYFLEGK